MAPSLAPAPETVTGRLAGFLGEAWAGPLPAAVLHQARRLLLNAAAASLAGHDHPAVRRLAAWATGGDGGGEVRLLWHGDLVVADRAALVNGAMLEALDFNETHLEAFVHPTAPVWPAVQAAAEMSGGSLGEALRALALGIEVELATATMLMPAHYDRGFNPAVAAGAVGAAAGCSLVLGLDSDRTSHALGLAALGGAGPLEVLGSDVHPYRIGDAARSGLVAASLAQAGFTAPATAIEGEHGLLASVAEHDPARVAAILDSLGDGWRLLGPIAFKRYPTETISQAPLDCTLELRRRTPPERRAQLASLSFRVAPLAAEVTRSRRSRFAVPADDQQARFDGSFCVAAAWCRGRFTTRELDATARVDRHVLAVRDCVTFVADPALGMESAALEATFVDGSRERTATHAFKGSPDNPMSDDELRTKFVDCAAGVVPADRIDAIAAAIDGTSGDPAISDFLALLVR